MAATLRIMVVDDQADLAESVGRLLRLDGHDVSVFTSAPSLLEALRDSIPDLIFADIAMPDMDGCRLATEIKQRPDCQRVVLAALTGFSDDSYRQAAIEAGFDYRFVKPMRPEDLEHFVRELAARREARR